MRLSLTKTTEEYESLRELTAQQERINVWHTSLIIGSSVDCVQHLRHKVDITF